MDEDFERAPDAVVQSTAPVTGLKTGSIKGWKGKHGQVGKGKRKGTLKYGALEESWW